MRLATLLVFLVVQAFAQQDSLESLAKEFYKVANQPSLDVAGQLSVFQRLDQLRLTQGSSVVADWVSTSKQVVNANKALRICIVVSSEVNSTSLLQLVRVSSAFKERGWRTTFLTTDDNIELSDVEQVKVPDVEIVMTGTDQQLTSYAVFQQLKQMERFDVIWFAEATLGYYSLIAKHDGLNLESSLHVVNVDHLLRFTHSPDSVEDLEVDYMEQRVVELADLILTPIPQALSSVVTSAGWNRKRVYGLPILPFHNLAVAPAVSSDLPVKLQVPVATVNPRSIVAFCEAVDHIPVHSLGVTFLTVEENRESIKQAIDECNPQGFQPDIHIVENLLDLLDHTIADEVNSVSFQKLFVLLEDDGMDTAFFATHLMWKNLPFIARSGSIVQSLIKPSEHNSLLFQWVDGDEEANTKSIRDKLNSAVSALKASQISTASAAKFTQEDSKNAWTNILSTVVRLAEEAALPIPAKTKLPLVSVCIVHHERAHLLPQALKALEEQTYNYFEIIIVDDSSTDEASHNLLAELEKKRSIGTHTLRVVRSQENRYLGAARNLAARSALGEYLLFLDDDNVPYPTQIAKYVSVALHTNADEVTAGHSVFTGGDYPTMESVYRGWVPLGPSLHVGLFKNNFGDANFFVKKEVFLKVGGFTEEKNVGQEEKEFHVKMVLKGYKLEIIPEPLLFYRMHDKPSDQMLFSTNEWQTHLRGMRPYFDALDNGNGEVKHSIMNLLASRQVLPRTLGNVTNLSPAQACRGTNLTITGGGYTTMGLYNVTIGPYPCDAFHAVSDSEIQCQIPYVLDETATDLVVYVIGTLETIVSSLTFNFSCDPCDYTNVDSASPLAGCAGTLVGIHGEGFLCEEITEVTFGNLPCNRFHVLSDSLITCSIPQSPDNLTDIEIIRSAGSNVTFCTTFTYNATCESESCSAYEDGANKCHLDFDGFSVDTTLNADVGNGTTVSLVVRTIGTDDSVPKHTLIGTVETFDSRLFYEDEDGNIIQIDTDGFINNYSVDIDTPSTKRALNYGYVTVMFLNSTTNTWVPASLTCSDTIITTYSLPASVPLCELGIFYISFGIISHPDIDVLDLGPNAPGASINIGDHIYNLTQLSDSSNFGSPITSLGSPFYGAIEFSNASLVVTASGGVPGASWPFNVTTHYYDSANQELTIFLPDDTGAFYFFLQPGADTLWEFEITTTCETTLSFPFNQPISYATGLVIWAKHIAAAIDRIHIKGNSTGGIAVGFFAIAPAIFDSYKSYVVADFHYLTTPNTDVTFSYFLRDWFNQPVEGALSYIQAGDDRVVAISVTGGPRPLDDYSDRVVVRNDSDAAGEYVFDVLPKGPGKYNITVKTRCGVHTGGSWLLPVGCDLGPANDASKRYYCYVDYYGVRFKETLPLTNHLHSDIVPATVWTFGNIDISYFDCECVQQQYVPFPV